MNWLATLNDSQLKAVIYPHAPLFVVAGAGTGKTRTLTTRIAYLIMNHVKADRILAVTFTNKAAREMKQRVIEMTGPHAMDVWLYTFHAFGLQILRRHITALPYGYRPHFTVIDEDDGKRIIQEVIKTLAIDKKDRTLRYYKHIISLYKCMRLPEFERTEEEAIYKAYQTYLKENQLVDFDDLEIYPLELLQGYKDIREYYQTYFEHILVDEFQDTDQIQYQIIKLLGQTHKNVFVVGDPDQSIYGFRGAHYQNNEDFVKDFEADKIVLEHNYRSTNLILRAANQLIGYNINRPAAKNLESSLGLGHPPVYHHAQSDYRETYFVVNEIERLVHLGYRYEDIAILYRNNALSRIFEDTFIKQGIPYIIYGGISFYERKEVKDALAYVRIALDPSQDFYLKRIINVPKRALGMVSVQKLEQEAGKLGLSMFEAIDHVQLTPQAQTALKTFKEMVLEMNDDIAQMIDLEQVVPYILHKTGYLDMLRSDQDELSDDRIDNLKELQSVFTQGDRYYEGSFDRKLTQLLDQIALYTDLDKYVEDDNQVKLSTVHQVKGLEFKIVFMVVMEENIFPSAQSLLSALDLEEERRVAYVGTTRAKERLYLSYADQRMIYGTVKFSFPSRFINESRIDFDKPKTVETATPVSNLLKTGDHVEHNTFGNGVVVSIENDVATIAFALPHGIKKILESHPGLRKIKRGFS